MARLTTKERKALPKSDFAIPGKAPKSGSFPIPDKSHAANAMARAANKSPAIKAAVKRKVRAKYPDMGKK